MMAPHSSTGGSASPWMNTSAVCQSSLVTTSYELILSANDLIRSLRNSRCTFARLILAQHPLKSGWYVTTDTLEALWQASVPSHLNSPAALPGPSRRSPPPSSVAQVAALRQERDGTNPTQ